MYTHTNLCTRLSAVGTFDSYIYVYTYMHMYVHTCIHAYMFMHINSGAAHASKRGGVIRLIYICTYTHTYVHTYTYICTYM